MASHSHPREDRISVVLCDDVAALRALMRATLEAEADVTVVGEAGDAEAGVAVIARVKPDVVLLDLSMPGMDGLEAIPLIREASPSTAIVVFSGFSAARMRQLALDQGATGYLEKGEALERLARVVRDAAGQRAA